MSEKLRIGVLGLTHDHVWAEVAAASECQSAELVAAADPNAPLTERFTETYGCRVYEDATSLLENEQLDAAYVFGSNLEGS
ncbi:MAG: Gfo/Idh/MocA family oxidoreductase, partial [Opitutales bacterium]|nr:Gfo/Idh/MocA family oxidoreductase [Opitutales bacterium]